MRSDATTGPPVARPGGARHPVLPLFVLALLLAAAAAGVVLLLRPHLLFTNQLAAPVRLAVGAKAPRVIAPGEMVRIALRRGATTVAQWESIRPLSADSQPMGEVVRGATVLREPSGGVRLAASSRTAEAAWFAPLITNATSHPLLVTVNAGLRGPLDCGCAVRPGRRRVFVGYYRLYLNSTVRARSPGVGAATFRDLGPKVTTSNGTVGLRFEDRDLR